MMLQQKSAYFRFYEELNDFLSKDRRKESFLYRFWGNPAIKDAIEAVGVPHTEIEIILVNGISVGFDHRLQNEDRVSVYPVFESLDVTPLIRLRPLPLRRTRFILDVHLGKLARLLRMLGFDTLYQKDYGDDEIRTLAGKEQRIILTRDQDLLKAKNVTHGYWLRSIQPLQQIAEIVERFDLKSQARPFTRCLDCNGLIQKVNPEELDLEIPDYARKFYQEFFRCKHCNKIYWQGSHYHKMNDKIAGIISDGTE